MSMIRTLWKLFAAFVFIAAMSASARAEDLGIFERVLESSGSFADTTAAFEKALATSSLTLHAKHDLSFEGKKQQARVYILTSPTYMAASAAERAESASAQILRVGIYEYGQGRPTHINMTNPVAHAMVFYSGSKGYAGMLAAAKAVAQEIRAVTAQVPGRQVNVQLEPTRSEGALNKFKGDTPAQMMTLFRNWHESQADIFTAKAGDYAATVANVEAVLRASKDTTMEEPEGWNVLAKIQVGNTTYFGITNKYTENKCVNINSDFRSDGKSKPDAPHPGVDHTPALPLEVLVINDGKKTRVVQYGEMWRMQLYFWDSGYAAFAKNTLIPAKLVDAIEETVVTAQK